MLWVGGYVGGEMLWVGCSLIQVFERRDVVGGCVAGYMYVGGEMGGWGSVW